MIRSQNACVQTNIENASVTVMLHGATIVSWSIGDNEKLFLSDLAVLDGSKAVRGGIPLVFPIFGTHAASKLPQHGFARLSSWTFAGLTESTESNTLSFTLTDSGISPEYRAMWPHAFKLTYSVTLTPTTLSTSLTIINKDMHSFEYNSLLHTYFLVKDVREIGVKGLQGIYFEDRDGSKGPEERVAIKFEAEVDRVYQCVPADAVIDIEEGGHRLVRITKHNATDVVVWNPHVAKAAGMKDFGDDEYLKMVGDVSVPREIRAGDSFEMSQTMSCSTTPSMS